MKKNLMKLAVLLVMLLLVTLVSCDTVSKITGQSKDQCLADFYSNANNGNWTEMYKQFHPDNPEYEGYKSGQAFQSAFAGETPLTYEVTYTSDDAYNVRVNYNSTSDRTETFYFRKDGDHWRILSCTVAGVSL